MKGHIEGHVQGVAREYQADLPQVPEDQVDHSGAQAQVELVGDKFHRHPAGRKDIPVTVKRVRIVAGTDPQVGQTIYEPVHDLPPTVTPSDLPHVPMATGEAQDIALEGAPSLRTIRKRGSSTSGTDLDRETRARGGNPDHRIEKSGGFFSKKERKRVKKLAKLRKT